MQILTPAGTQCLRMLQMHSELTGFHFQGYIDSTPWIGHHTQIYGRLDIPCRHGVASVPDTSMDFLQWGLSWTIHIQATRGTGWRQHERKVETDRRTEFRPFFSLGDSDSCPLTSWTWIVHQRPPSKKIHRLGSGTHHVADCCQVPAPYDFCWFCVVF